MGECLGYCGRGQSPCVFFTAVLEGLVLLPHSTPTVLLCHVHLTVCDGEGDHPFWEPWIHDAALICALEGSGTSVVLSVCVPIGLLW